MYSIERAMASGTGGGVGMAEPVGWKPFSSAMYEIWTGTPSGEVH